MGKVYKSLHIWARKKYSAAKIGYFSVKIVSSKQHIVNKYLHIIYSSILTKWVKNSILMVEVILWQKVYKKQFKRFMLALNKVLAGK